MSSATHAPAETRSAAALYVVARVGGERFAFPIGDIEEAIDAPRVDGVPGAAAGLAGELRYRERTVSAFDSGWVLGVSRAGIGGTALILRDGTKRLALLVDDVEDLAACAADVVQPVPAGTDGDGVLSGVWFAGAAKLIGLVNTVALLTRVASLGAGAKGEI